MNVIEIRLGVHAKHTDAALKAWETLTRTAAGLAFEGLPVELSIDRMDLDHDGDRIDDDDLETADDTDTDDQA